MKKPCYLNENSFKVPETKYKPIAELIFDQITIRLHIDFYKKQEKFYGPKSMNYANEGSLDILKNQQFSLG